MAKKVAILLVVSLISSAMLFSGTLSGYLTERMGWTYIASGSDVEMSIYPPEGVSALADERIFYGQIRIGDSTVNIAIMNVEPPILWIDSDYDGCFLNNIPIKGQYRGTVINESRAYKFSQQLRVEYLSNGNSSYMTQDLEIHAILPKKEGVEVDYLLMSRREGLLEVDGELIEIALFPTAPDGLADKIDEVFIGIDLNRDGTIDMVHKNHELFEATSVIRINDKNYRVSEISRDGRKVTFEQVDEDAQNRPLLKKGSIAPLFEARDVFGETFSMSDYLGNPIIVVVTSKTPLEVFTGGFPCATGDCEDTGREEKRLRSLLSELVAWNEYSAKPEVELIWLYSGDEITSADSLEEYSWLHLIADKSAVELYSTPLSNGMFLISKDGKIEYLDDYVVQAGHGSIPIYPVFRIPTFGITSYSWFREFVFNK
jgi:hypothetical protein